MLLSNQNSIIIRKLIHTLSETMLVFKCPQYIRHLTQSMCGDKQTNLSVFTTNQPHLCQIQRAAGQREWLPPGQLGTNPLGSGRQSFQDARQLRHCY